MIQVPPGLTTAQLQQRITLLNYRIDDLLRLFRNNYPAYFIQVSGEDPNAHTIAECQLCIECPTEIESLKAWIQLQAENLTAERLMYHAALAEQLNRNTTVPEEVKDRI